MKKNIYTNIFFSIALLTFISCGYFNKIRSLKNVTVKEIYVLYDTSVLRIPGNIFNIGIGVIARQKDTLTKHNDTLLFTKGYLNGTLKWSNFIIRPFDCKYSNGKIKIPDQDWPEKGNVALDVEVKTQPQKRQYLTIPRNYIKDIKLISQNVFHKAPGNNIKLGIIKTFDNSSLEILKKKSEVDKFLSKCNIYVTGGEYKNGYFRISEDIFSIDFHQVGLIAEPVSEPSLADTFSVQLDYIANYVENIYATSGNSGSMGMSGSSGVSAGCYGCNGSDGQSGEQGSDGENGEPGHDVSVDFDAYFDTILKTDLCIVNIEDLTDKKIKYYLVNPKGGSLNLSSNGGRGGSGGDGGYGGNGGSGGAGETHTYERRKSITVTDSTGSHTVEEVETYTVTDPGGSGGNGGNGGNGGVGGIGGDGGNIYVYYTEASLPYLNCLIVKSFGGSGGFSGSGGFAGSGGSGGTGNPPGSGGYSGSTGSSGWSAAPGRDGKVLFIKKENK